MRYQRLDPDTWEEAEEDARFVEAELKSAPTGAKSASLQVT